MKKKEQLDQNILNITMHINEEFPELSKYIREMPIEEFESSNHEIKIKNLKEYYNSLLEILEKYAKTHGKNTETEKPGQKKFSAYPIYPPSEDIYNQGLQETDLDPNDLSKNKVPNVAPESRNEKDFEEDMSGDDLDVPGSSLDNQQESVGSEDEENNYYSLGGENHNDLEEDKG